MVLKKIKITLPLLKNAILGTQNPVHSLLSLIEYHNEKDGEMLEWGTMKNYQTTQKYLLSFIKKQYRLNDLPLTELNYQFITLFQIYLRKLKNSRGEISMQINGVMKHLERLCKMAHLAVRLEWIDKYPFSAHQPKFTKVERQCLDIKELRAIENKYFKVNRLRLVKDLFLFSCYTGLSYIDVFNLKPENISTGIDGNAWLITSRQKTGTPTKVPLLATALDVIEKYRYSPEAKITGKLLPAFSNQKLNSYLKEIADLCGITKPLTFHIARHTFATTVTLSNGVPIETVSKMLRHSRISTTQVYAKVIEKKIGEDMEMLKAKMSAKFYQVRSISVALAYKNFVTDKSILHFQDYKPYLLNNAV